MISTGRHQPPGNHRERESSSKSFRFLWCPSNPLRFVTDADLDAYRRRMISKEG